MQTEEKEIICESGNEYLLSCDIEWYWENYGEDADGNRGMMTLFKSVDDVTCEPKAKEEDWEEVHQEMCDFQRWCEESCEPEEKEYATE